MIEMIKSIPLRKYFNMLIGMVLLLWGSLACVTTPKRPCTEGGQLAHENTVSTSGAPLPKKGKISCFQSKNSEGVYVNDGKYMEWYEDEQIALIGEYSMGKKTGRWIEYDEDGKKISDKYFSDGKEVPRP